MRVLRASAALLVLMLSPSSLSLAQTSAPDDQLRKDIEVLKEGQRAIQKDLEEIKRLLQSRLAAAAPPASVVLDLGKNAFKGERTAKLTLVEFSDYQ